MAGLIATTQPSEVMLATAFCKTISAKRDFVKILENKFPGQVRDLPFYIDFLSTARIKKILDATIDVKGDENADASIRLWIHGDGIGESENFVRTADEWKFEFLYFFHIYKSPAAGEANEFAQGYSTEIEVIHELCKEVNENKYPTIGLAFREFEVRVLGIEPSPGAVKPTTRASS